MPRDPLPLRPVLTRAFRLLPAALAAGLACAQSAPVRPAATDGPVEVQAQSIQGRPDLDAVAEGQVELRRGALELQADWLSYEQAQDLARARGAVRLRNPSGRFAGDEVQLQLQRYEGFVLQPAYEFDRVQAGGRAARIDFVDRDRSVITRGWYTSCPRADGDRPDWVLQTDRVQIDFARNEGVAEGAVVRFLGVPILALPTMSFPVGEGRKSGWLPPTLDFDTKSGLSVAVPYYWNIAPNRDATLTPRLITRRGAGLDTEFRYLERGFAGSVRADLLPDDRVAGRSRWSLWGVHDGQLPLGGRWHFDGFRVSDDAWWKDFPKDTRSLTTRLLPTRLEAERDLSGPWGQGQAYARMLRWQVLQGSDVTVVSPYERAPQLGARFDGAVAIGGLPGLQWQLQTEANRFVLPDRSGTAAEPTGWRAHALGTLALPWRQPGAWLVPRLRLNAASYSLDQALADGRRQASRLIPSVSVEAGLEFERDTTLFGRALRQTLEPRVLYVNTPFRDQTGLPNFDSAGKDFNFNSIFSDNAFSGVDRVSDAHQVTAGVTTRMLDAASGAEAGRLGVVQRLLLRPQRITPDGVTTTQRFSDIFVLGSAAVSSQVSVEGALQYSPDIQRPIRTVASARWSPGEFRTISTTYRYTRGLTEQLDVGWQWPLFSRPVARSGCGGTLYSVGRVNYSKKDSRVTDSIVGVEYDAGCWIARVVAERRSTGLSEATTHVQLQLELVGLSRLGSNPLRVLKDNIPGYRLLREERDSTPPVPSLP
ncbi:MAG: LPS-assembly protein LptD [Rubrivivax sp.]|nr:LPS-assembly protein LptD [Rubrivivax sp.]